MASGYEINAKPVPPDLTTSGTSTFILWARLPKMPKMIRPERHEVKVSRVVTTMASLK